MTNFCSPIDMPGRRGLLLATTLLGGGLAPLPVLAAAVQPVPVAAPGQTVQPAAADSGNDAETVVVVAKRKATDLDGFSNAAKASGQTVKLSAAQTQIRITQRELLEASIPIGSFTSALANQPNIVLPTTTSPIVGGDIYLRGFSKGLLNVTLDGIPINLVDNYAVYVNQLLPLGLTGSLDLKPGAGSASTVGYSDFGGSIDVNSANPAQHFFVTPEIGYGSFNEQKYGVTVNSGLLPDQRTSFIVTYNHQSADGFFDKGNDGTITRTGAVPSDDQVAGKLVSQVGPGTLSVLGSYTQETFYTVNGGSASGIARYGAEADIYTGPSNPASYWANQYKKEHNTIDYVDYTLPLGDKVTLSERPFYWNYFSYTTSVPTSKPYSSHYIQESLLQDNRFGNIAKADIDLMPGLRIETGLLYDHSDFTNSGPLYALTPNYAVVPYSSHITDETLTIQPYAEAHVALTDRLTVIPGIKYSYVQRDYRNQLNFQGYDTHWRDALPSLGLNYRLLGTRAAPHLSLYANYTRSFEPPSFSQISTTAQNLALAPEYADSFEAGPIWDIGRWSGKLSAFDTHFLNFIQTVTISNAANPNGVATYGNAGGATYQGIDFNNSFRLTRTLAAFANAGLLDAHFSHLSAPITFAPKNTDTMGLRYQGDRVQAGASFEYNIGYFYQTIANVYRKSTPYFTANLFVSYKLPVELPHVESAVLSLNIDNAFDRQYIVQGNSYAGLPTYSYALPLNAFADLKVRFH